jgi:hypothetical protein
MLMQEAIFRTTFLGTAFGGYRRSRHSRWVSSRPMRLAQNTYATRTNVGVHANIIPNAMGDYVRTTVD